MKPTIDMYPVFEANQVLTNSHLNQVFNYLDEQERLTRANLIGIGIVCGLEITINSASVSLTRGCGVTSEGYLIIEPLDVELVSYRADYQVPLDVAYSQFSSGGTQFAISELFPVGEPNTLPLTAAELSDKVVVLFLELKKDDLANCSPNNCDDKGAEITTTVRRLLMRRQDAAVMVAAANGLGSGLSQANLMAAIEARLDLPDLRLPRYDVPATRLVSSVDVLAAFQHVFEQSNFVNDTRTALTATYQAFQVVIGEKYPVNPFTGFLPKYRFLQTGPTTAEQVVFLQYYYDLFDDIVRAYDEFRWKGVELLCACCPPEGLFPRHLILGPQFRHVFLASAALSGCEERIAELNVLFERLVEMLDKFTNDPALPQQARNVKTDGQIRITPSTLGREPLSEKAIPYYYEHGGQPPIRDLWNPELTQRQRANQNFSYWSSHYSPAAPAFVQNALGYDIEPYNFMRVEGHLGKNYVSALRTLLALKARHRLPIDIIALRTGAFDENTPIDLSKEDCRFRDLETLYDALRDELLCSIRKSVRGFNDRPFTRSPLTSGGTAGTGTAAGTRSATAAGASTTARRKFNDAPAEEFKIAYTTRANTVGAYVEELIRTQGIENVNAVAETPIVNAVVNSVTLLHRFALVLSKDLFEVEWDKFDTLYEALKVWSDNISARRDQAVDDGDLSFAELDRELMNVIFACRLDAFKSLREEYARRIREVKQKQYFSHFITKNPGIQHKAGVPIGGTFILVYHQSDDARATFTGGNTRVEPGDTRIAGETRFRADETRAASERSRFSEKDVDEAVSNLRKNASLSGERDVQLLIAGIQRAREANELTFGGRDLIPGGRDLTDNRIFENTVADFANGTIIADFFVPYLCCSDCMPIQYTIVEPKQEEPSEPLTFTVTRKCTDSKNVAEVTIAAAGGVAPYQVQINAGALAPLSGPILLPAGANSIIVQDSAGMRTAAQTETIPEQLSTTQLTFVDDPAQGLYTAEFRITGGTAPYTASRGTLTGDKVTVPSIKSDEIVNIDITDARNCTTAIRIQHTINSGCDKPCEGIAERCRYWAWMAKPTKEERFVYRKVGVAGLSIIDETGKAHQFPDVHPMIESILAPGFAVTEANYDDVMLKIFENLNAMTREALGVDAFVYGYAKAESGLLSIEHYKCHSFTFQIRFTALVGDVVREESWTYTEKDVTIVATSPDKETQVLPKFGCIDLDKCKGTTGNEPPNSKAVIEFKETPNGMSLTTTLTPAMNNAKFTWRIDGNITVISKEATLVLDQKLTMPFSVRVQALAAKSAWSYGEQHPSKPDNTPTDTPTGGTTPGGTRPGGTTPGRTRPGGTTPGGGPIVTPTRRPG